VAWSLINLALLERLIVALTGRDRGTFPATGRAIAAIGGFMLLFAAGWLLLARLPAALLMAGFAIPFAVIVLQAASLLVLPARAWRWLTRTPWPAVAVLVALVGGAWLVSTGGSRARAGTAAATVAAAQAPGSEAGVAGETAAGEHGASAAHEGE